MANAELIEEILDFRDKVIEEKNATNVVNFKLTDIEFDEKNVILNGAEMSKKCLTKVLSDLRVKSTFLKYKTEIDEEDFNIVKDILTQSKHNLQTEFYAKKVFLKEENKSVISDLFKKGKEITTSLDVDILKHFDTIINSLRSSDDIEFVKKSFVFNPIEDDVNISLLEVDGNIDIFNDKSDIWKRGINFNWDCLKFSSSPFFERLICANGLVAETHGYKTNIQQKTFNAEKIQRTIDEMIINVNGKFNETVIQCCNHLKSNQISLNEFLTFKKFFEKHSEEDGRYEHIIDKVFNDSDIYKAYGINIKDKSKKWLATANSGRNAYDFFNDLTQVRTHEDIDFSIKKELDIMISNLFFKEELDLEDVAQFNDFVVPKAFVDKKI